MPFRRMTLSEKSATFRDHAPGGHSVARPERIQCRRNGWAEIIDNAARGEMGAVGVNGVQAGRLKSAVGCDGPDSAIQYVIS
jgi:hypothetical protein